MYAFLALRPARLLLALGLAAAPALASDTLFGLQAHLAMPTGVYGDGAHLDRKLGWGVGFQVPFDFGGGHVLRPRLDYLAFRRDEGGVRYRADSLVLLADYNYFLTEEREGAYLIGGLGLHHTRRDVSRTLVGVTANADRGATGLAYNVGLGFMVTRNLAFEVKYLGLDMGNLSFRPSGMDSRFMGNAVQLSVSCTF